MSSSSQATPGQPAGRHGGGTGETKERPGLIGLPLAIVGAVVLLIGVTSVNWYNVPNMNTLVTMANHEPYLLGVKVPTDTKFTHFGALAKLLHAGLAQFLAGPAGWVLIVLLIVFAIVANLPFGKIAQWLRIVTPVLAVVGLALLVFAIKGFWHQAANYHLALAGPLP
ncbi:MAG: hypothetical protein FWD74_09160, partial [Actinomycetia bacterium]|nr:hypothetical protein [Actinomycetes bacterium]